MKHIKNIYLTMIRYLIVCILAMMIAISFGGNIPHIGTWQFWLSILGILGFYYLGFYDGINK